MAATGSDTPPKMAEKAQVEDTERQAVQAPASVRSFLEHGATSVITMVTDLDMLNRTVWRIYPMSIGRT